MKGMAVVAASVAQAPAGGVLPGRTSLDPAEARAVPPAEPADLEPTIYRFIIRHSWKQQIALLLFTLASFPFLYVSLNLPKTIINHAIREDATFPQSVLGFEFDRVPYLMVLCGAFLGVVLLNGGFK